MVRADGTALRELVGPPPEASNPFGSTNTDLIANTALYGWNAAGTALGFSQGPGVALMYKLLEISSGNVTQLGAHAAFWGATRGSGDWREGRPAFVGAFVDSPAGSGFVPYHIDVAEDQLGRGARTVFDAAVDVNMHLRDARWRPGSSDVLYVGSVFDASKRTMNLFVTDATGRTPREIKSVSPAQLVAAWTPDGRDIVWVEALGNAAAVHLMRPDGTNDRFVTSFALPGPATVDLGLDLAVLGF
jgi:hypothetical protein